VLIYFLDFEMDAQALSLLTPAQKDRWSGMLGKPFVPQIASNKNESRPVR